MRSRLSTMASRRHVLRAASAALIAGVGPTIIVPRQARAQQKVLTILRWKHFVPSYDTWFNETYVEEWGRRNDTRVVVDNVGLSEVDGFAAAEAVARKGHDLVLFLAPPPIYEDLVIDHREILQECERKYGRAADFALRSSYNPKTDKFFAFCEGFIPAVISYRKDLWDAVGIVPDTWDAVLDGGRKLKFLYETPIGISLAPENNSNYSLRALMHSFGASVQDADGNPALKSKETLAALEFGMALYRDAMTEDVLGWNAPSNNRFMLSGDGSLTVDTLSIARAAESRDLPVNKTLALANVPAGPADRLAPTFGTLTSIIWQFAENIEGAKQFMVDYIGESKAAFLASGFQNMPSFLDLVPDLDAVLVADTASGGTDRYRVLADVPAATTNVGHPGYANAPIDEIFTTGLIPQMFARAATGQMAPAESLDQADAEVRRIFTKWRGLGKV